ncbi:MAG: riboflavin kinase [Candidatus Moraniibacteriota bacterium]
MEKLKGIVIEGKKLGRKLGFPTANFRTATALESGVYAGWVVLAGKKYLSAIFIWPAKRLLEAYLLDFEGDLYGKELEVEIFAKIREALKFENQVQLIAQIEKDVATVRKWSVL